MMTLKKVEQSATLVAVSQEHLNGLMDHKASVMAELNDLEQKIARASMDLTAAEKLHKANQQALDNHLNSADLIAKYYGDDLTGMTQVEADVLSRAFPDPDFIMDESAFAVIEHAHNIMQGVAS